MARLYEALPQTWAISKRSASPESCKEEEVEDDDDDDDEEGIGFAFGFLCFIKSFTI